jgi:hypothetical protein
MVLTLMGLCWRLDPAGVTSYVRVLGLRPEAYHRFLHLFHSKGLDLDKLTACWVKVCLTLFKPVCAGLPLGLSGRRHQGAQGGQADARR